MVLTILHLNASDSLGGSGRSAYRIHTGLRRAGARSRMLVGNKATTDRDVRLLSERLVWHALDRVLGTLTSRLSLEHLLRPSSFALAVDRWFQEADVVQLYNTHDAFFSHTALPLISAARPLVWRLSDMWPLTGHCAYSFDCTRWRTGCGACPHLDTYPPLRRDTTALLWAIKRLVYARSRLTLVAPSRWMEKLVGESPLLRRFSVYYIPNGVDTALFRPMVRAAARQVLGLPVDGPVILFGTQRAEDPRKGGGLLAAALRLVGERLTSRATVVTIGSGVPAWPLPSSLSHRPLGLISDDLLLAAAYAAADVFVLPTLADNLPNTLLESLSCGTPCVSFAVGGVPEIIQHLATGYLAEPGNAADLAHGILHVLGDEPRRQAMAERGRAFIREHHDAATEVNRYLDLYRELLEQRRSRRPS